MAKQGKLKIIPLGGLGEVGKNMTAYEFDHKIIIVDAGIMFPENDMLGIDYIIPDYAYVRERAVAGRRHHHHARTRRPYRRDPAPGDRHTGAHLRHAADTRPDRGQAGPGGQVGPRAAEHRAGGAETGSGSIQDRDSSTSRIPSRTRSVWASRHQPGWSST